MITREGTLAPIRHIQELIATLAPANAFRAGFDAELEPDNDPMHSRLWFDFIHTLDEFDGDEAEAIQDQRIRLTILLKEVFGLKDRDWLRFSETGYASVITYVLDDNGVDRSWDETYLDVDAWVNGPIHPEPARWDD